jgi:hypothetical protein
MHILGFPYNVTAGLAAEWDEKRSVEADASKPSDIFFLKCFQ